MTMQELQRLFSPQSTAGALTWNYTIAERPDVGQPFSFNKKEFDPAKKTLDQLASELADFTCYQETPWPGFTRGV